MLCQYVINRTRQFTVKDLSSYFSVLQAEFTDVSAKINMHVC